MTNESTNEGNILTKALNEIREILEDDVNKYWDAIDKEDNQFWRRGFVRAAFAYIEGLIYTMKIEALYMHQILRSDVSRLKNPVKKVESFEEFTKALGERMAEIDKGLVFHLGNCFIL